MQSEVDGLRDRLETAVHSHLMSDVPLGVFLSGGLDSSALAALVARAIKEPVRTFAVGFRERDANELEFARLAAKSVGAEHRDVVVTPEQYFNALPDLVWHEDEPIAFPSSVPLYFVSRLAREHVKVVLTGEGADELFLGYNRYRVTLWNARFGSAYWAIAPRRLRRHVRDLVETLPESIARYARRGFVALEPGYRSLFFENFAVFPEAFAAGSLRPCLLRRAGPLRRPGALLRGRAGTMLERMGRVDLQTYLQELLMKQDQMSMASSIESRVPFLDDRLVEHVAAMPGRLKLRGWTTKAVLRAAVRDLVPPRSSRAARWGFPCRSGRWLRGSFWPVVEELGSGMACPIARVLQSAHRAAAGRRTPWRTRCVTTTGSGCSSTWKSGIEFFARVRHLPMSCVPSARSHQGRSMRILWVKMGGLWPSTSGGRVRSLRIIGELSRRHRVTVITTHGPDEDPKGLALHLSRCNSVMSIPYVVPKKESATFPAAVARSWLSPYPVDLWKWCVPGRAG
jgi:asparagine synthetase B (glutamine-hydrolysing)